MLLSYRMFKCIRALSELHIHAVAGVVLPAPPGNMQNSPFAAPQLKCRMQPDLRPPCRLLRITV
jgi:hypothetical protein